MSNFGFQREASRESSWTEKLLELAERFSPLLLGLGIGAFLVIVFGRFPTKWVAFIILAAIGLSIMALVLTFTNKIRETLLFCAIPTLPLMYNITPGYRENVTFTVMANGFPIELFDIALFFLLVGWLHQLWIKTNTISLYFPNKWATVLVALLIINIYSALFVARESFFSFSMIYNQLKCYLIVFFLANYIRDTGSLRVIGYAFAAILISQGLIVIEQLFIGVVFTAENLGREIALQSAAGMGTINRVAGTLGHPNNMAMYLNLIIPWVGFQMMSEKFIPRRVYLGIALFLGLFAVLASGSRGAWLGLFLGCFIAVLLWYQKQGKSPITALFILFVTLSILFVTLFAASNTFRTRLTSDDRGAAEVRVPLMEVAKEIVISHPFEGIGLANYTREMVLYDRTTINVASFYNEPVHNTFLLMAAETGIPSLVLFIGILIFALRAAYLLAMKANNELSALGFGLLASLPCWFIHNQVNHTAPFMDTTFWLLMGLLLAAQNQISRQQSDSRNA